MVMQSGCLAKQLEQQERCSSSIETCAMIFARTVPVFATEAFNHPAQLSTTSTFRWKKKMKKRVRDDRQKAARSVRHQEAIHNVTINRQGVPHREQLHSCFERVTLYGH